MAATPPLFIQATADQIIAKANEFFEGLTGRQLQPAQTEALMLKTCAYLTKTYAVDAFNAGAAKMLLAFSTAPIIDYLVELVGVTRLAAQPATCTLQFAIITGHTGVTIPAGTRVQSGDGKVAFATTVDKVVAAGVYIADVEAEALTAGEIGNGYGIGAVNSILDPLAFVITASNSQETDGGAEQETDAQLYQRAKLAPNAFSTAGSEDAYKYHALSAHPSITDVGIRTPPDTVAGTVQIYPLVKGGGVTPAPVLAAVNTALNKKTVRPVCDTVVVTSPTAVPYTIACALTLFDTLTSDGERVRAQVEQMLNDFAQDNKAKLGGDVMLSELIRIAKADGVYNPVFGAPVADIIINQTQYGDCASVIVTIAGYNGG